MSKREIKTKKIIYKEVIMSGVSKTLQSILMELLKKHTKADSRKEMVNPGEEAKAQAGFPQELPLNSLKLC